MVAPPKPWLNGDEGFQSSEDLDGLGGSRTAPLVKQPLVGLTPTMTTVATW
jgi:hypothetical protein